MHQDIKTFSDLTDIDTKRKLLVSLTLHKHGHTVSLVKLNNFVINVDKLTFEFDLFDPVKLEVNLTEFIEGCSGIDVELSINGLEVLPKYQHLSSNKKCYIDKKGIWTFEIPDSFYTWYHQISGQGFIA